MLKTVILLILAAYIVCDDEAIPKVDSLKFLKTEETSPQPPHIIFICADDLVSYQYAYVCTTLIFIEEFNSNIIKVQISAKFTYIVLHFNYSMKKFCAKVLKVEMKQDSTT